MSLKPDDRSRRGRSNSPGGRERSRSRSNVGLPEAPEIPRTSYTYPASPSAVPYGNGSGNGGVTSPAYGVNTPTGNSGNPYFPASPSANSMPGSFQQVSMPYPEDNGGFTMGGYTDFPPHERPGYVPPAEQYPPPPLPPRKKSKDDDLAYGKDYSKRENLSRHSSYSRVSSGQYQYAQPPDKITYTAKPVGSQSPPAVIYNQNACGQPPPQTVRYNSTPYGQPQSQEYGYSVTPQGQFHEQMPSTYSHNAYEPDAHVVDITPGRERLERHGSSSRTNRLAVNTQPGSSLSAPRSPGLGPRMDRLSVSGNRPDLQALGGSMPPPSPLLEAYYGTYQSISPMPLAIRPDDDLSDLDFEPLSPAVSREARPSATKPTNDRLAQDLARKEKKRVKLYDAEEDAKAIASALNHHKPDADAICDILPHLSHDQIMEVHKEYKKQVRVHGKGVNLSKHINMKLSGTMFGKAVYVTALGRWESEGYWANFWYQSHGSRRELLIESLMGRTNTEIRMIKEDFKDKRYSDSLVRCMEKELKMDKFRTAVLMVLEERRQEEQDSYPVEYLHRDVDLLYRSVRADKGGESAMLEIVIRRSDSHLREVLRTYERMYGENFARAALRKSNNLVGEVIAHILNGVINKPARDALLLHHALRDISDKNTADELRYELLISRLVRVHWDRAHLARVKREFYDKYRRPLVEAVQAATAPKKGDLREFLCELCEAGG
ncbi:Annexin A7 [Lecanosticta acicola]|uniref:Annexin A7 n=1 Tax=Lecanosticta acicola TaxID=111012 RepID=A0AAI8YRG7_9PEZI|nr:Annexin A7 [Lecanosticta acicola]